MGSGSVAMATEPGGCIDVVQCLSIVKPTDIHRDSLFLGTDNRQHLGYQEYRSLKEVTCAV